MGEIRSFEDLIVWQRAHQFFLDVVKDVDAFSPGMAARIIGNQVLRSASSISANIAEGFGRRTGKEYTHYLIVARGSTTETLNWYLKCRDLHLIESAVFVTRRATLEEILILRQFLYELHQP
ncbi:MAG: four helix bundle protein [Deltaproteobacteria bacterium]|nr:four helix bundle protein [Deltaproteobacteria bacterium]